jgi:hypothetical protein
MPLDPNGLHRKKPSIWLTVLPAVEWSAIVFTGMLSVLFLSWALALGMPSETVTLSTDSHSGLAEGFPSIE